MEPNRSEYPPECGRWLKYQFSRLESDDYRWKTIHRSVSQTLDGPYFLPFISIYPLHMKKNIQFPMLLRAIRYCSTFDLFIAERQRIRVALLLSKYPNKLMDQQFQILLEKYWKTSKLTFTRYSIIQKKVFEYYLTLRVIKLIMRQHCLYISLTVYRCDYSHHSSICC